MGKTSAIVIIGNEILSGKVRDENGPFLSSAFRALGVDVRRIVVVPDEESDIAEEVSSCSRRYDWVVTTGGVGPTHDDVTMAGIARGFGRKVVRDGGLEDYIKSRFGPNLNDAMLKLAEVPEGAVLIKGEGIRFPIVALANVYIFPGIPEVTRRKFEAIKETFRDQPFHIRKIYLNVPEEEIAAHLLAVLKSHPGLILGSYPATKPTDDAVALTLESKDPQYLEAAFQELLSLLPKEKIRNTE
jgi:molybdenum cofactor synthesis domain-containing protein